MLLACFTEKVTGYATVYSIKTPDDIIIDDSQILYIEGEFYGNYNKDIIDLLAELI